MFLQRIHRNDVNNGSCNHHIFRSATPASSIAAVSTSAALTRNTHGAARNRTMPLSLGLHPHEPLACPAATRKQRLAAHQTRSANQHRGSPCPQPSAPLAGDQHSGPQAIMYEPPATLIYTMSPGRFAVTLCISSSPPACRKSQKPMPPAPTCNLGR